MIIMIIKLKYLFTILKYISKMIEKKKKNLANFEGFYHNF